MSDKVTTSGPGSFRTTVYGKYFLLDRIAVGGMAEVFKAKTFGVRGFERLLVIKRILPHLSKDEDFVEMFIDEAKISVELSHANIVQVTDLGKIGDNYFIAMEYIDGKDLRAILKKAQTSNRLLSVEQASFITIESCKGLDYAHRKKSSATNKPLDIIHRDISPQNIMISYEGEVKVVDFGIAKTASKINQTQAGVLKGKFGYMSPEQAMGLDVDQRTDIFSTGIILFEMLTGRRLFLGDTDFETLEKIKEAKIPPPSLFNPSVPKELERIVFKALAKDMIRRYSTIREMQVDLTRFFYTGYPDFTAGNLSSYLKKLFRDEIKSEREKLKESLSSLPIEGLIDSELASHSDEQLIDSQQSGERMPTQKDIARRNLEQITSPGERDGASRVARLYEKTVGLVYKASGSMGPGFKSWIAKNKHMVLGASFFLVFAVSLVIILMPGNESRLQPEATPTPDKGTPTREFSPTPPSAKNLSLKITSTPEDASITVNGKGTDLKTPATLENLVAGQEYNIELRLPGYSAVQKAFTPGPDADNKLDVTLQKIEAVLTVRTYPTGVNVSIENFGIKKSPATFKSMASGKTYRITAYKKGYEVINRDFKFAGESETLEFTLKRQKEEFGYISLGASPWAQVSIDENVIGNTPKIRYKVSVGTHTVKFSHPNAPTIIKKVTVAKDKEEKIIVEMAVKD